MHFHILTNVICTLYTIIKKSVNSIPFLLYLPFAHKAFISANIISFSAQCRSYLFNRRENPRGIVLYIKNWSKNATVAARQLKKQEEEVKKEHQK